MHRSDEAIKADLNSKSPERIKAAIRDLKEKMKSLDQLIIPPFGADILIPFGDNVPEETQLDFLAIIRNYRSFIPALSEEDKMSASIAVVLRYAVGYIAFDVALKLKTSRQPVQAVQAALQEIARQGLNSPMKIQGAANLVSRLLEGKNEVRQATLQGLRQWPAEVPYQKVADYIRPQLEPDELEFLNQYQ